jgi:hypothetical protein
MPVDDRIREGFERNADSVRPEIDAALTAVVEVARRRVRLRRSMLSFVAALSAIALVVLAPRALDLLRDGNAPPAPGTTVPSASSSPARPPDPLSGTWGTSWTCVQEEAAVAQAGLTKVAARLHFRCRDNRTTTVIFNDGILETRGQGEGVGWRGSYKVIDADTFVAGHETFGGELYLRYRFTIRGSTLTVHLLEDAYPIRGPGRDQRAGDLVAQVIGWDSAPFHRLPDQA